MLRHFRRGRSSGVFEIDFERAFDRSEEEALLVPDGNRSLPNVGSVGDETFEVLDCDVLQRQA